MRETFENVTRNVPAYTLLLTIVGVVSYSSVTMTKLQEELASTKREFKLQIDSNRRELEQKIANVKAESEIVSTNNFLKFNHSQEYKSLQHTATESRSGEEKLQTRQNIQPDSQAPSK
jgi:hypothetical protein